VLGRSPECHIQVADPWISSMHALFERRGDQLWLVDLDSRNGTFVDGNRIAEQPVAPGMKLRFGRTSAEVRSQTAAIDRNGVLSDQRTVVRPISDIACEAPTSRPHEPSSITPLPQQMAARADTLRTPRSGSAISSHRSIAVLNEIGRTTLAPADTEDALRRVLSILAGTLMADRAGALLMDEHGAMVPLLSDPPDRLPEASGDVVDAMLRSRGGVLAVADAGDAPASPGGPSLPLTRSRICAPIWLDHRILGAFVLERAGTSKAFTAEDLELATLVGLHAALAVERSRTSARAQAADDARARLMRHVDAGFAARLLKPDAEGTDPLAPMVREDASVVAVALAGAGALATSRPASEIAARVLALQRALANAARAEGAAVDERLDAGLLVVFGLAQRRPEGPALALRCARAMLDRAEALEAAYDAPRLQLRIGVESGWVVAGNFGTTEHPDLRTLGDAVDTALRLAAEAAPGEALAGPGVSRRSRRAGDEPLEPRAGGTGALRRLGAR
jgi:class 3 adenylate cyclase